MTPSREHNNFLVTGAKEMEIYELPDIEFKIIVLSKFSELQENTERKPNEIRKIIHGQNERFNKETEILNRTKKKFSS